MPDQNFSDLSPNVLINSLPKQNDWDVQYIDETLSFMEYNSLASTYGRNNHTSSPYFNNAYQIFQANKRIQQYKFFTHINMTATDASILFPQFMYESILKVATDDSEFEFKVKSTAYPMLDETRIEA